MNKLTAIAFARPFARSAPSFRAETQIVAFRRRARRVAASRLDARRRLGASSVRVDRRVARRRSPHAGQWRAAPFAPRRLIGESK